MSDRQDLLPFDSGAVMKQVSCFGIPAGTVSTFEGRRAQLIPLSFFLEQLLMEADIDVINHGGSDRQRTCKKRKNSQMSACTYKFGSLSAALHSRWFCIMAISFALMRIWATCSVVPTPVKWGACRYTLPTYQIPVAREGWHAARSSSRALPANYYSRPTI